MGLCQKFNLTEEKVLSGTIDQIKRHCDYNLSWSERVALRSYVKETLKEFDQYEEYPFCVYWETEAKFMKDFFGFQGYGQDFLSGKDPKVLGEYMRIQREKNSI